MNATVTCEKCGKPLGVFDGNTCADCSKIDAIRDEIERLHYHPKLDFIKNDEVVEMALDIIDKYREEQTDAT